MTEVRKLYLELLGLTRHWSRHDLVLSGEDRAKAIGRRLYEIGGEELMQRGYYFATGANPAASALSLFWDGIGDWKW